MYLVVNGNPEIELASINDVGRLVPVGFEGVALNYGQGEGQFSVSGTVWGVYVNERGQYQIQFEGGQKNWPKFQNLVNAIISQVKSEFGSHLTVKVEGVLKR